MEIRHHQEKFRRLLVTRQKLNPIQDFELWFWVSMTAATHIVNAALHKSGATRDDHYYPYHVFGLYVLPERDAKGWKRAPMPPGDIVHTGRPELKLSPDLQDAYSALHFLEDMREPFVRGHSLITPFVTASCEHAFKHCVETSNRVVGWL
jgi:hypothetical protein